VVKVDKILIALRHATGAKVYVKPMHSYLLLS